MQTALWATLFLHSSESLLLHADPNESQQGPQDPLANAQFTKENVCNIHTVNEVNWKANYPWLMHKHKCSSQNILLSKINIYLFWGENKQVLQCSSKESVHVFCSQYLALEVGQCSWMYWPFKSEGNFYAKGKSFMMFWALWMCGQTVKDWII